jgi:adenosylhomocysteine nucleosidase
MKIGIITAMPGESQAIIRALQHAKKIRTGERTMYQAQFRGHEIVVAEAGMGFANAAQAARQLMGKLRPDLMISAGFCGGISAELQVGDAVVAVGLLIVSETGLQEVPATIPAICQDFVSRQAEQGSRVFAGLFATTTAIMQKSRLAALLPADAPYPVVEMESAAIALEAAENGIPVIGLRTVSDPLDEELGFSLDDFCDDTMRIRIPRVLLTVVRKPRIIPQLIRLARNSRIAAASLAQAMERFLAVV